MIVSKNVSLTINGCTLSINKTLKEGHNNICLRSTKQARMVNLKHVNGW